MLNIKDIEKLHSDFPEPEEVENIRREMNNAFSNLVFKEKDHSYHVKESGKNVKLPSVSSIVSSFEPRENWDLITENYAAKNNMSVEAVSRMWKEKNIKSTNNGTLTHLFLESYMWFFLGHPEKIDPVILPQYQDGYLIPYGNKQVAGAKYFEDLYNTYYNDSVTIKVYPVLPEVRMYVHKDNNMGLNKRFAGTMDVSLAFLDPSDSKWKIICDDWKTNESLTNSFNRNKGNFLNEPFGDYINEAFSHYTIQLSAYSLMVKQTGFDVPYRNIVWLKEDGTYDRYPVSDESQRIIDYYNK